MWHNFPLKNVPPIPNMSLYQRQLIFLYFCLLPATASYAQLNIFRPEIIGQTPNPLVTSVNEPVTIELTNLIVLDADPLPVYPEGYTLEINPGRNYEVNENTITPSPDFTGVLRVPVRVSDGTFRSRPFNLRIEVNPKENEVPVITGHEPLNVRVDQTLTIGLQHLQVEDPDNNYPDDFTLTVASGPNYSVNDNTITPNPEFVGTLNVPVTVNDGEDDSEPFSVKVEVTPRENVAPIITGQEALATKEDTPLTLKLADLKVADPDNTYPADFQMAIDHGDNYSVSGLTITPDKNFSGTLTVRVLVNDGNANSEPFDLKITVESVNDAPVIIGQAALSTDVNAPITLNLLNLKVSDPDNTYPEGFSLTIHPGNNYTFTGLLITPYQDYSGTLTVNVSVNDGVASSAPYPLKIDVNQTASNTPPVITGQKIITMVEKSSLTIAFSHLNVTDPDSRYPADFTLEVLPGDQYTVKGNTITPLPAVTNATLTVPVVVNDGVDNSNTFELKVQVIPSSSTPIINGQKEITIDEDTSVEITLNHLEVTDNDNVGYPKGFSLNVLPGDGSSYTVSENTVTPTADLFGFIEVGVTVSDGVNESDEFKVAILINPVNDVPEIMNLDSTAVGYEPGAEPVSLFEDIELRDVDNDHLSMAEVGFRERNFSPDNDELTFVNESTAIKALYDPGGVLVLVGYAPIEDYRKLISSVQYRYITTTDESGNPEAIRNGPRTVYVSIHDGQVASDTLERRINLETEFALDIPNTFTPNGDQSNDTWQIYAPDMSQLKDAVIKVYNKRGHLVYESVGLESGWDGSANGETLPVGTYFYTIDLNLSYMKQTYKGFVTLLR